MDAKKKYSDWQLNRLRDALHAYYMYEHIDDCNYYQGIDRVEDNFTSDNERERENRNLEKKLEKMKQYLTWRDVCKEIEEETNIKIGSSIKAGAERLRQFVVGVTTENDGGKFPEPKASTVEGIVRFLTSEDRDLLSFDELNEFTPGYQAPLRLLEYLELDFDAARLVSPARLTGTYKMCRCEDDDFVVRELTLQRPMGNGLIQIIETEEIFDKEVEEIYDTLTLQEVKEHRNALTNHGGWAILSPEDNVFCFLKNERNGMNRYYFTLGSDLQHWSDVKPAQLVFLHHDYPLGGLNEQQAELSYIMDETIQRISCYMRIA